MRRGPKSEGRTALAPVVRCTPEQRAVVDRIDNFPSLVRSLLDSIGEQIERGYGVRNVIVYYALDVDENRRDAGECPPI